jgi:hypothetical protein
MKTCPACNSQNADEALFCSHCGASFSQPTPQPQQLPCQAQPPQYTSYRSPKDRSIALILEILPGLFGFLGIGWIYSGNTSNGLLWLIGFLLWTIIATVISVLTGGIGVICWLPISIGAIVLSAVNLNSYTKQHPEIFGG